jgi:hypothetical protein
MIAEPREEPQGRRNEMRKYLIGAALALLMIMPAQAKTFGMTVSKQSVQDQNWGGLYVVVLGVKNDSGAYVKVTYIECALVKDGHALELNTTLAQNLEPNDQVYVNMNFHLKTAHVRLEDLQCRVTEAY